MTTKQDVLTYLRSITVQELIELGRELIQSEQPENGLYTVRLDDCGARKVSMIRLLRRRIPELGLQEGKTVVENTPVVITSLPRSEATAFAEEIIAYGGTVTVSPVP